MWKVITIDCDNVLCNTTKSFIKYYEICYRDRVEYETFVQWYLWDNPVFPKFTNDSNNSAYLEFCRYVHDNEIEKPLDSAIEVIWMLKKIGYRLYVVTGRMNE